MDYLIQEYHWSRVTTNQYTKHETDTQLFLYLEFALGALSASHVLDQDVVVHKATDAKAGIAFQPRGQVTSHGNGSNRRLVRIAQIFAELHQNEARRGQGKTNQPGKALGFGRFPQRSRLKNNGH